jgi:hypothetical protein
MRLHYKLCLPCTKQSTNISHFANEICQDTDTSDTVFGSHSGPDLLAAKPRTQASWILK